MITIFLFISDIRARKYLNLRKGVVSYGEKRRFMLKNDVATGKKDDKEPFTQMERAKIVGLVLVFVMIFWGLAYFVIASASSSGSDSLSACEGHLFLASRYSCIENLANVTGNLSLCGALPTGQGYSCIYGVALKQMNASACELINSSQLLYSQCIVSLAKHLNSYSYCEKIRGTSALDCIASVAVAQGFQNIDACSTLDNSTLNTACTDFYNYHYALAQRNPADCAALNSKASYSDSYIISYGLTLNQSGHSAGLPAESEFLAQNATLADYCYYSLAALEGNPSICALSSLPSASTLCNYLLRNASITIATNVVK
jgi:hypothetical protein